MVNPILPRAYTINSPPSVERELGDVERVLVSVAKQLDEGGYPPDQASPRRHEQPIGIHSNP